MDIYFVHKLTSYIPQLSVEFLDDKQILFNTRYDKPPQTLTQVLFEGLETEESVGRICKVLSTHKTAEFPGATAAASASVGRCSGKLT